MVAFWHYFLKACEDLFIILWQAFQGMLRTRKIVSQQYTEPYAGARCRFDRLFGMAFEPRSPRYEVAYRDKQDA